MSDDDSPGEDTPNLTPRKSFEALGIFLEAYWERGKRSSEDIAVLLTDLNADPAQWSDWLDAIRRAKTNGR